MKKIAIILFFLGAIVISSCEKDDDPLYQIDVTVNFPENYNSTVVDGAWVYVTKEGTERTDSAQTDASGIASITKLSAGIYKVSATVSLTEAQTEAQTGVAEAVLLTVVENGVSVLMDTEKSITLAGAVLGDLVFKEVYYTGSRTPEGGVYFSDQYYEIYNNSTEIIYADKLCIGIVDAWGYRPEISVWLSEYPTQVAIASFWYIPGNGTDYPINPGESIIIAQDGINHKSDELGNPNSPVNLGDAEWETFVPRDDNRDIDAPAVPNLTLGFANSLGIDWLTSTMGCAYIIFHIDGDIDAYVNSNKVLKPESTSTKEYVLLNNDNIIDGFEAYKDDAEASMPKLHAVIDAGFTYDPNGTYTGKCVRRKVKTVINGRTIYQDTNNSTNDFLIDQECSPRIY
jgi:hypothetical protein